jgi:hypothetical protein
MSNFIFNNIKSALKGGVSTPKNKMSAVKKPVPTMDEMNNLAWSIASTVRWCVKEGWSAEQLRILERDGRRWGKMMDRLRLGQKQNHDR